MSCCPSQIIARPLLWDFSCCPLQSALLAVQLGEVMLSGGFWISGSKQLKVANLAELLPMGFLWPAETAVLLVRPSTGSVQQLTVRPVLGRSAGVAALGADEEKRGVMEMLLHMPRATWPGSQVWQQKCF